MDGPPGRTCRIIDTHAHLCDPVFDEDRKDVLERARDAGVLSVLCVSETLADAQKNLRLAAEYPVLRPMAGLYPTHLDWDQAEAVVGFIRAHRDEFVGIGEVGLDLWKVKEGSERGVQEEIFVGFIELSKELDLPLNVHSRSAGRYVIDLLLAHGAERVQLHAFDGRASSALPAVEAGYLFSIPPSIVRSRQKQKLVKQLPLSCLLLETDSPVLGPVPGRRNEPKHILKAVETVAKIQGILREEVVEATFRNTCRLYGERILGGESS